MIRKSFYFILLVLVAVLALLLLIKNPEKVEFHYIFLGTKETGVGLLMFSTFIIGVLVGATLMSVSWLKQKFYTTATKRKLTKVEKEVEVLKSQPIQERT